MSALLLLTLHVHCAAVRKGVMDPFPQSEARRDFERQLVRQMGRSASVLVSATVLFLGVEVRLFAGGVLAEGYPSLILVCAIAAVLAIVASIALGWYAAGESAAAPKTTCGLIVSSTVFFALGLMVLQLSTVGRFYTEESPERDAVPGWLRLLSNDLLLAAGLALVLAVGLFVARMVPSLRRRRN